MGREHKTPDQVIYVCTGSSCKKRGGKSIAKHLRKLAKDHGLKNEVEIIKTDCTDRCKLAPICALQPQNLWLTEVTEEEAEKIFRKEVLGLYTSDNL